MTDSINLNPSKFATKYSLPLFVLAFAICGNCTADDPPNIVYINTDDWGIGKVPSYKLDDASMKIISGQAGARRDEVYSRLRRQRGLWTVAM